MTGGSIGFQIPLTEIKIGLTRLIRMGEWGVDIFFVLSGVLLTTPLIRKGLQPFLKEDAIKFYIRRALRILPAFYFTLLLLIYLLQFGLGKTPSAAEMLQHAFFVNTWFGTNHLRGAFWSLPVEVAFYAFLPIFLNFAYRLQSFFTIFITLIISTILLRYIFVNHDVGDKGFLLFSFLGRMDQFALGAICAHFLINKPPSPRSGTIYLTLGLLGLIAYASFIGKREDMFSNKDAWYYFFQTIVGTLAAITIYGAASASKLGKLLFGNKAMVFIGTVSFSLYLWHTIILDFFSLSQVSKIPGANLASTLLYTWPFIFIASFLSYLFVERPFLHIRHDQSHMQASLLQRHPVRCLIGFAFLLALLSELALRVTTSYQP